MGRGGAILTELVSPFGGSYVCANFGENRSQNATVRQWTDEYTDRRKRFYNPSHVICYVAMRQRKILILCTAIGLERLFGITDNVKYGQRRISRPINIGHLVRSLGSFVTKRFVEFTAG